MKNSRRNFIKYAGGGLLMAPLMSSALTSQLGTDLIPFDPEKKAKNEMPPYKPATSMKFNITEYGAVGDGKTMNTEAIQHAIDRCWVLGGGEVIIPAGEFLTGSIGLKTNVALRLEKDAILKGSNDLKDYLVTQVRWEGKWIQGHTGLIYAFDAENIAIIGEGKVAGSYEVGGRPNKENPLRHPALIEPINCKNIHIEGFSTDYYHMWCIHPTYCKDVYIKNLYIRSKGGNGDGIDIDSCKHVQIDGCDILTGDDCIAIKSGRGMEGNKLMWTTEDVHITNCTFGDTIFACVGIGSEGSGGVRNVRIEHCKFTLAKTFAVYIKSRPGRGAFYENIYVDDIDVSGMEGGFLRFNMGSGLQDQVPVPGEEGIPYWKNFHLSNIRVHDVPVLVTGTSVHPKKPLDGFTLENVTGTCKKGIELANIKNAKLANIDVTGYEGPLLGIHNVTGKGLEGAVEIPAPKVKPTTPPNDPPYVLH